MKPLVALVCGTIFGAGLTVSGMTNPEKVIAFLDVLGNWNPTLAVVMASALLVNVPAFHLARRRQRPWLDRKFFLPSRVHVDRDLMLGSALFGIGWGLAGLCPGPAIAGLASALPEMAVFVLAMAAGVAIEGAHMRFRHRRQAGNS